jgi:hypothetical protein
VQFVQGIDYGPRKGTLGWNIHIAEGGDGTVGFLAKHPGETNLEWRKRVRGVSANFVIKQDGTPVQMVAWDNAAGNLNPDDRSTDKVFYGRRYLLEVLPTQWQDPNAYTISIEMCGFRAEGPSQAQVDTVVDLVEESKQRYPGIRGAFGHADQTDTKGCPGLAPNMRQLWTRIGHGLFAAGGSDVAIKAGGTGQVRPDTGYQITLGDGRDFFNDPACTDRRGEMGSTQTLPYAGRPLGVSGSRAVWVFTSQGYAGDAAPVWTMVYVVEDAGTPVPVPPPEPVPEPKPLPPITPLAPGLYEVKP